MTVGPNSTWLVRHGDLILGPMTLQEMAAKLLAGEINPDTEVQQTGTRDFIQIEKVPDQSVHLAVAKARIKQAHDASAAELATEQKKRGSRILWVIGGLVLVIGGAVAVFGSRLAIHGDSDSVSDGSEITVDAPTFAKAQRGSGEDLVAYGVAQRPSAGGRGGQGGGASDKPKMGAADSEGLAVSTVDEAGLSAVVAKNKPTLIHCIKESVPLGPVAQKIPIEFTVTNAGQVSKVFVDNKTYKDNDNLKNCLMGELKKWQFKPGTSGSGISLSFNVPAVK